MILTVNGADRESNSYLFDAMFRIRARVFHERLGWDVVVKDGREIDSFDACHPLYIVSVDEISGRVRGSLRLLPTTGPNMLRDVFPVLLGDGEIVESATVWESSRFSIDQEFGVPLPGQKLSYVTGELLAGIVEIGLSVGLTEVVSVFDARMVRIFRSAGCPAEIIGTPQRIGTCMTYAGLFEISERALQSIREACGLTHDVIGTRLVRPQTVA